MTTPETFGIRLRKRIGGHLFRGGFEGLSAVGRLHPRARAEIRRHDIVRDLAYRPGGAEHHLLDVWRPKTHTGPLPVVLYVHGGAFHILSKESHWIMAAAFARRGYVVVNVNYRLAPRHKFPAAVEDACHALDWTWRNAERFGGDRSRLVLAGESAGANLVTSLALACSYERAEPYARALFDAGIRPRAVVAQCGILQVSDSARFGRALRLPVWLDDRMVEMADGYLGRSRAALGDRALDLADPLVVLERGDPPARPLPSFFASCGTKDPLLDDTRRLERALARMGVPCEAPIYPGEVHAFQAFVWRAAARDAWKRTHEFVARAIADAGAAPDDRDRGDPTRSTHAAHSS